MKSGEFENNVIEMPLALQHVRENEALRAAKCEWGIDQHHKGNAELARFVAVQLSQFEIARRLRSAWQATGGTILFVEVTTVDGIREYWAVDGALRCVRLNAIYEVIEEIWWYDPSIPIVSCYFNAWALVAKRLHAAAPAQNGSYTARILSFRHSHA